MMTSPAVKPFPCTLSPTSLDKAVTTPAWGATSVVRLRLSLASCRDASPLRIANSALRTLSFALVRLALAVR